MTAHCSGCGTANPDTEDGYTTCCNEPECGPYTGRRTWILGEHVGGPKIDADTACCAHAAEKANPGLIALYAV